jgi:hypothetical protein
MRKIVAAAALAAFAFSSVAAGQAPADPPEGYQFSMELKKGQAEAYEGASDDGGILISSLALGLFGEFDPNGCSADYADEKCDRGLLTLAGSGTVTVDFVASFDPVADYDLAVYTWDGEAAVDEVATSGNSGGLENVEFKAKRGEEYVIVVQYFAAGGGYTLDVAVG